MSHGCLMTPSEKVTTRSPRNLNADDFVYYLLGTGSKDSRLDLLPGLEALIGDLSTCTTSRGGHGARYGSSVRRKIVWRGDGRALVWVSAVANLQTM